jgi:hypothetical protein
VCVCVCVCVCGSALWNNLRSDRGEWDLFRAFFVWIAPTQRRLVLESGRMQLFLARSMKRGNRSALLVVVAFCVLICFSGFRCPGGLCNRPDDRRRQLMRLCVHSCRPVQVDRTCPAPISDAAVPRTTADGFCLRHYDVNHAWSLGTGYLAWTIVHLFSASLLCPSPLRRSPSLSHRLVPCIVRATHAPILNPHCSSTLCVCSGASHRRFPHPPPSCLCSAKRARRSVRTSRSDDLRATTPAVRRRQTGSTMTR